MPKITHSNVMKDSTYQYLCTILLGVATLFRYIGSGIAPFIVESLVHSAHIRESGAIIEHAGYYGQAVMEISTCLATFVVPIILNYSSPKWTLVIGSVFYSFYFVSFFFINNVIYFIANVLLGIAFAMIFTSFNACQMIFSTRKTLARNSAAIQAITSLSLVANVLIFSGLLYMYITATREITYTNTNIDKHYRYYSNCETRTMFAFLFGFCMVNLVLTCWLPTKEVDNSVASESPLLKVDLRRQIRLTISTLTDVEVLLFIPRFFNHGLLISFVMSVYPTSLQYSTILADKYPMMTAYYAFSMCSGTMFCGIIVASLNKYFTDFGLRPLFYIAVAAQLMSYSLAALTVPDLSTSRPTDDAAIIYPHVSWVCLIAFLVGFADSANVPSGTVLCSRLLPGRPYHTYSAARFYRGLASSVIFFCSPIMTMKAHAIILISVTLLSALTFDFALKQIEKRNQNKTGMKSRTIICGKHACVSPTR